MPKRRHQIELELENPFLMFPLPSFNVSRQNAGEVIEEQETARSFSKLFSKLSGKGLTDQNANVLLEIFPLLGAVLLNLLCAIDWDPQSTLFQVKRCEPSGSHQ